MGAHSIFEAIIALLLKFANILIHTLGLYLLQCADKSGRQNVQTVYIKNLSRTDLLINIFSFIRNLLKILPLHNLHESNSYKEIVTYSYIFDYAALKLCLYMWMFYITIDRLLGVLLNFSYPVYWDSFKAKILVRITWTIALIVFIIASALHSSRNDEIYLFDVANVVIIIVDIAFVVTAILSYTQIFARFQRTRKRSMLCANRLNRKQNSWKIFRRSRFYVSVLLIATFIIFTIIPDFMWMFKFVGTKHSVSEFLMTIMYAVSYLVDGIIYIFMDEKIKKILMSKLPINQKCKKKNSEITRKQCVREKLVMEQLMISFV